MTLTRRLTAAVLTLVALLAAAAVIWRVLKPAEVLATATGAEPVAVVRAPEVTGRLTIAPLIVAGKIRVYTAKRQLRADGPVDAKTLYTPSWSYRRWPEQLNGVVAVGSTVVSRWSDGVVVALNGLTGALLWRADGPAAGDYTGLRTGAETVWAPPGMFTTAGEVLVTGGGQVFTFKLADGSVQRSPGCGDGFTTLGGQYVCQPVTPLGCGVASSGCAGYRDASGQGWLTTSATPVRTPGLDAPEHHRRRRDRPDRARPDGHRPALALGPIRPGATCRSWAGRRARSCC